MSVVRTEKRSNPYTMLDNSMIVDKRLTFGARGLLAYLLSKPTNWTVRISDLVANNPRGADHIYSLLKELREYGYARIVVKQTENGRLAGKEWVIHETPTDLTDIGKTPTSGKPRHREKPDIGKNRNTGKPRRIVNTDSLVSTEEELEKKDSARAKKTTPTPDDFAVTEDLKFWAKDAGIRVDLDRETETFLDYHRAKGSRFKDWAAAWRNWMRRTTTFAGAKSKPTAKNEDPNYPSWLKGAL